MKKPKIDLSIDAANIWGITRITLGSIFLWAFFDKLLGLGFSTCRDLKTSNISIGCADAWVSGGSPTSGFLNFGTSGPFADIFQSMSGSWFTDWLFMFGLLGLGAALILGIGMRIAAYSGSLLMLLMWAAALPVENHPVVDEHIIYALVLFSLLSVNDSQKFGQGRRWAKTSLVRRYPILK